MKIVALDGHTLNPGDNAWTPIESLGDFSVFPATRPEEIVERAGGHEVVLTNKVVLDADVISALPDLKFISVLATGYNVVDVAFARQRQIPVSNVPVYSTQSVAQHVFAMLLSFIHRPYQHHLAIQDGEWQRRDNFSFWLNPLTELSGKVMGIVGLGRIGRATASLANAFGMKVIAHSRTEKDDLPFDGFEWVGRDELFARSDVVSLHCPQTDSNVGFVNQGLLEQMKSTAILVNTARGGLINEPDLANALNQGRLAGALLDVVSAEPIQSNNPLLEAKNCILNPHIAWTTIEARRRLMQTTAENIRAFIDGSPINLVN